MANATSSKTDIFNMLLSDSDLKISPLRKDILKIVLFSKKSLGAYDILKKLKKIRPNAEPPTVYRVMDYFIEKKIVHRIETENKFIFCSHPHDFKSEFHGILFVCKNCSSSFEVSEKNFSQTTKNLAKKYHFSLSDPIVEIKGLCQNCSNLDS